MRFNDKELAEASFGPAVLEGRLNHKRAHKSGWFKVDVICVSFNVTNQLVIRHLSFDTFNSFFYCLRTVHRHLSKSYFIIL